MIELRIDLNMNRKMYLHINRWRIMRRNRFYGQQLQDLCTYSTYDMHI